MRFAANATVREMSNLIVGELIIFGHDRQEIGIALTATENGNGPLVGSLNPPGEDHPRIDRPWGDEPCLSLGCDWIIEPILDASVFPGNALSHRSGLLSLDKAGWVMSFAADSVDERGRFSLEWWKIGSEGGEVNSVSRQAVGFAKWRIWADEETRLSPRGMPLFEYEAKAPAPR